MCYFLYCAKNGTIMLNKDTFWNKCVLTYFKTFRNTFFTDKDIFLKKINYFLNNENLYKKRGIPYNLGILMYGEPGCGKTSCIKALSNMTNRHIVEVDLKKIKTCEEFQKIFNSDNMDGTFIPHDKKIIVLEDIDCMSNIVHQRKDDDDCNNNEFLNFDSDVAKFLLLQEKMSSKQESTKINNDNNLTLSCILNTIDGIFENYGRILIITTNYVDKLDSALIRPGRIDIKINFTKCTNKMCHDIINNFYGSDNKSVDEDNNDDNNDDNKKNNRVSP
jgi:chaperone BCS1